MPTQSHESDGTLAWDATTLVLAEVVAGGSKGLGFSYSAAAAVGVIREALAPALEKREATAVDACWWAMLEATRNLGRQGVVASAISAVDLALWDLKAKLFDLPLADLLGRLRPDIEVYGSGGFTSYDVDELRAQLTGFADQGMSRVKIKVGRRPEEDVARVVASRDAVGRDIELMVDANGAYDVAQAVTMAEAFSCYDVRWFEEPVSSDDLLGLRFVREHAPAPVRIAAGEYGWDPYGFAEMLDAGAVDVLQADITRCLGLTGLIRVAHACELRHRPLSFHCAPLMHLHAACVLRPALHLEYFFDHTRIEAMLFDGPRAEQGRIRPDARAPGHGIVFKEADAQRYAA